MSLSVKKGKCRKKRQVQGLTWFAAAGDPAQEPVESVVRPVVQEAADNVQVCGREAVARRVTWVKHRRGGGVEATGTASAARVLHTDVTQRHTATHRHTATQSYTQTHSHTQSYTQTHRCNTQSYTQTHRCNTQSYTQTHRCNTHSYTQ